MLYAVWDLLRNFSALGAARPQGHAAEPAGGGGQRSAHHRHANISVSRAETLDQVDISLVSRPHEAIFAADVIMCNNWRASCCTGSTTDSQLHSHTWYRMVTLLIYYICSARNFACFVIWSPHHILQGGPGPAGASIAGPSVHQSRVGGPAAGKGNRRFLKVRMKNACITVCICLVASCNSDRCPCIHGSTLYHCMTKAVHEVSCSPLQGRIHVLKSLLACLRA